MKILQISNDYYSTKLYRILFEKLLKLGIENDIYVFASNKHENKEKEENIVFQKCYSEFMRGIYPLKQWLIFKNFCKNFKDIRRYNLVHAHTVFSNGDIAYRIYKKYNIPYIVAVRNTDLNVFFKYMIHLRKHGVEILENAERIIFLSPEYQKKCIEKYIPTDKQKLILKKSLVITNGIDDFWFEKVVENKKIDNSIIRVVYAGSIDSNKNTITTIKSCKYLVEKGYRVKFTVIGKIVDTSQLTKDDFVEHIDFCNKEKLIEYYRKNDIFVMPSKTETFGLVYAEALTQGLPVIYTKGEGFDGQIEEGKVGYNVKYDDYIDIAEKIVKIFNNYNYYTQNIKYYLPKFNWENISEEYFKIYSEVLKKKNVK